MKCVKSVLVLTLIVFAAIVFSGGFNISSELFPVPRMAFGQSSFTNMTSYLVSGSPNYSSPGNESFWSNIGWTSVPLAASVSPGGGHTSNLLVKSANNGYDIFMLFKWNDSQGPSYGTGSEIYKAANGSLLELTPESTANVTQLYYNSTYYYPDRVAMLWFTESASQMKESPAMQLGSGGAITGGSAEIWHWQSVPTDNNPNDQDFPGGYTTPSGTPIFPPDNLSFAEDDYTNTTGFFVVAGSFGNSTPNLDPYANPYVVKVGNYFYNSSKSWTVEMARSFTTTHATQYRVQLTAGSSYFVAFAVWNGKVGESAELKSVSQWYNLKISDLSPPTLTSTTSVSTGGVSPTLAAVAGAGLLIVGLIVGGLALSRDRSKKSTSVG